MRKSMFVSDTYHLECMHAMIIYQNNAVFAKYDYVQIASTSPGLPHKLDGAHSAYG